MDSVICPITHEVLAKAACLAHAIETRPAPCGYDFALLRKMFADSNRTGLHTTDLLGCPKRTVLTKQNPVPEPVHAMLARVLGTLTHAVLEQEDGEAISEMKVGHGGIVGTVDLYYPQQKTVVDFKTTRWLKIANLPYGEHEWQVNIYAWMLEGTGQAVEKLFLQYIDLSGPSKCRNCKVYVEVRNGELICPNCLAPQKDAHLGTALIEIEKKDTDEVTAFVEERKSIIETGQKTGFVDAEPSWLCHYCAHRSTCDEGIMFTRRV